MTILSNHADRNARSGYWGRQLTKRKIGELTFQLHEACAPPESVIAHGHERAHIVFVTRGAYVTSLTGENSFVANPVAVINPPGTWHRDHFVGGRGSFMTIDLESEGLLSARPRHDQSRAMLARLSRISRDLELSNDLELEDEGALLSHAFEMRLQSEDVSPEAIDNAYHVIMDSTAPWQLTMAEIARQAGMHASSLPRAFRKHFGKTASQIAKARQVELCAAVIAKGDLNLADAAAEFGFYDQSHMTNVFRNIIGQSPARWKAQARQG